MNDKNRTFSIFLPMNVPTRVIRRAGVVAAVVSVAAAVPAALFAEPIVMGVAAGMASVAAILGVESSHRNAQQRLAKSKAPSDRSHLEAAR